jgi:hypothetical protein
LEQPTKMVAAAELAPSDNNLPMMHEAHHKTSDNDIPLSSAAMDTWQAKVDSSAAYQSEAVCADETTKQSDASLPYSKALSVDKDNPGFTKEDDSCLCSGCTSGDMSDSIHGDVNDTNNTTKETFDPIDTTRQPMNATISPLLKDSDLNQQNCAPQFEDGPPATTQTTIESDKATGDVDIIFSGRLGSSDTAIETAGIQQTEEASDSGELTVASHTEALAVEQIQEAFVPNKEETIDSVVLKQDCNTEPCGDAAVAREVTEEMYGSAERAVSELAKARTEPIEICDPKQNESVLAAGLENNCSGQKHDDSTASSEHVVAPEPIKNETSVMQVEHEATAKEDGCCTAAASSPSFEAIMKLEAHEETPAAEANETIAGVEVCMDLESHAAEVEHETTEKEVVNYTAADCGPSSEAIMEVTAHEKTPATETNETIAGVEVCKDPESHMSGEVSMAVESSDLSSASAVQSDTLNISAHVPVLLECTENRSPGSHDSHDAEQLTEMVSTIVPAPTGDKEITQGNFSNARAQMHTHGAVLVQNDKDVICSFYFQ